MSDQPAALAIGGLTKSFAGVRALKGVDLVVAGDEIHALLGENGAGKSTLIKILAGVITPDGGSVVSNGVPLPLEFGPAEVQRSGIRFVHQDLGLVDSLSVAENIAFVTGFPKRFGLIDRRSTNALATAALAALGFALAPDRLVGELPQAEKVMVALARACRTTPVWWCSTKSPRASRVLTSNAYTPASGLRAVGASPSCT